MTFLVLCTAGPPSTYLHPQTQTWVSSGIPPLRLVHLFICCDTFLLTTDRFASVYSLKQCDSHLPILWMSRSSTPHYLKYVAPPRRRECEAKLCACVLETFVCVVSQCRTRCVMAFGVNGPGSIRLTFALYVIPIHPCSLGIPSKTS